MGTHTNRTASGMNSAKGSRNRLLSSGLLTGALVALMSVGTPSTASAASTCTTNIDCGRTGTGSSGCTGGDCGKIYINEGSTQIYYPLVATSSTGSSAKASTPSPSANPFRFFIDPLNMLFGRRD